MEYTDEELKAIGQVQKMIDFDENLKGWQVTSDGEEITKTQLDIILNLIEKQETKINRYEYLKLEYKYLEEKYKKLLYSKIGVDLSLGDYIPKEAIREKIRELEDEKGCYFSQCFIEERDNKIQVLKELLGE